VKSKQCIRPLPYVAKAECKRLKLLPGAILEGKFTRPKGVDKPHTRVKMAQSGQVAAAGVTGLDLEYFLKNGIF
jgi:hypothetical protein